MNIREYKSEDRNQIEKLIAELQDYEAQYTSGMRVGKDMAGEYLDKGILKYCREKNGKFFVAEESDELIGFIWVWIENEPRDLMYIKPIYTFMFIGDYVISKEYRNRGIGKALIAEVERFAKEQGIDQLKLHVNAKNSLAREVYKKLGFEEDEVILVKKI